MNDIYYSSYILPKLLSSLDKEDGILVQDNHPAHKGKLTTKKLEKLKIAVLDWPSNLPDLSQLENIWSTFKNKLIFHNKTNIKQLEKEVIQTWNKVDIKEIRKVIRTFPQRVAEIIRNKGNKLKY